MTRRSGSLSKKLTTNINKLLVLSHRPTRAPSPGVFHSPALHHKLCHSLSGVGGRKHPHSQGTRPPPPPTVPTRQLGHYSAPSNWHPGASRAECQRSALAEGRARAGETHGEELGGLKKRLLLPLLHFNYTLFSMISAACRVDVDGGGLLGGFKGPRAFGGVNQDGRVYPVELQTDRTRLNGS